MLALPLGAMICNPQGKVLHGKHVQGMNEWLLDSKGQGAVTNPTLLPPTLILQVHLNRPPKQSASFQSAACAHSLHTAQHQARGFCALCSPWKVKALSHRIALQNNSRGLPTFPPDQTSPSLFIQLSNQIRVSLKEQRAGTVLPLE